MDYHNISRNQICPCGSNKKFKHCHGSLSVDNNNAADNINFNSDSIFSKNGYYIKSLMSQELKHICQSLPSGFPSSYRNIPPGLLVIENFINDEDCNKIINQTENFRYSQASIEKIKQKSNNNTTKIDESQRKTEIFYLENFNDFVKSKLESLFKTTIRTHYNKVIDFYEQPHILRYSPGGFYNLHSDSEYWDSTNLTWNRTNRRELSFLIYLNDDFVGGTLDFPNFDFQYVPKKGSLVCFPSDHRFMHKALQTISGTRFAIVTWAMIKDSEFEESVQPLNLDMLLKV